MRAARIFLTGFAALLALVLIVTNFQAAIYVFAGIITALVVVGFLVPIPGTFSFSLPAIATTELDEFAPDIKAQPYPQIFIFDAKIRNLGLLLVAPLYSLGLTAFVLSRPDLKWAGSFEWEKFPGPFVQPIGGILTGLAVTLAWSWAMERLLLRKSHMRLGIIHAQMGDGEWSYEYFDLEKNRHGGTAFPWNRITHRVMPVFVDSRTGERSKPAFAFIFHNFILAESRHLPEQLR